MKHNRPRWNTTGLDRANINVRKNNDNNKELGKWKKTIQTNIVVNDLYDTSLC